MNQEVQGVIEDEHQHSGLEQGEGTGQCVGSHFEVVAVVDRGQDEIQRRQAREPIEAGKEEL